MKRACVALVLLLWPSVYGAPESPGNAAYERANALFKARKFSESATAVDEALRLDPKLVPALTLKAKLAMAMNRFDVARQTLEQALAADSTSSYAQFLYGLQFYLANDLQRALPQFEKAQKLNPSDSRAVLYLGLTSESLGRTSEALALYEEAVRLDRAAGTPKAEALLAGSRLLLLLGRLDECERWIQSALKSEPNSRDAHFEFARLLLKKGDAKAAAVQGEMALSFKDGDITDNQIHYLLIRAYQENSPANAARHAAILRSLEAR